MELLFLSALARNSAGELTCASGAPGPRERGACLSARTSKRFPFLDRTPASRSSIGLISLTISIILIISII